MAKNEELGKLSPEQVQKLANTISEAKNLPSQQEEIIGKVLNGEIKIGSTRIAYLEEYFDIYSKKLDLIARKHSNLNDSFLILDQKLANNYKTLSSDISELAKQLADLSAQSIEVTNKQATSKSSSGGKSTSDYNKRLGSIIELLNNNQEILKDIRQKAADNSTEQNQLLKQVSKLIGELGTANSKQVSNTFGKDLSSGSSALEYRPISNAEQAIANAQEVAKQAPSLNTGIDSTIEMIGTDLSAIRELIDKYLGDNSEKPPKDTSTSNSGGGRNTGGNKDDSGMGASEPPPKGVYNSQSDENRAKLTETITIFDDIAALKEAEKAVHNLNEAKKSGDAESIKAAQEAYDRVQALWQGHLEELKTENNEYLESIAKKQEAANAKYIKLELAKSQTQEMQEARLLELRLNILDETLAAEIEVQNLRNKLLTNQENSEVLQAERLKKLWVDYEEDLLKSELALQDKRDKLAMAQDKSKEARALRLKEFQIAQENEVLDAKIKAQDAANNVETRLDAISNDKKRKNFGKQRAEQDDAEYNTKADEKRAEQIAKFQAQRELYYKQKNNGVLSKEDAARVQKEINEKFKKQKQNEENLSKERGRLATIEYQQSRKQQREETREGISNVFKEGATLEERQQALYGLTHDENGNFDIGKSLSAAVTAVADLVAQLEDQIDSIAEQKGFIDTRLQGSNNKTASGSYWGQLTKDMMSVGAVTPFFKQEKFAENIRSLVDQGIAFDLKQRAFLMTIQEKIANTFNVADGTLLRLIRIQQEDSTAGRLGMESALNSFLNNMYETSEYLSDVAKSVRSSLEEMESLMSGAEATEVEYQVQKWMGSLYSVGMSQEAVNNIASALGQIAAGQVDALTNGNGAGNLMVMAANKAGKSIAEILTKGLDATETNELLQATVNYLAELADASKDSKVVQQQLAGVFGVKASDLRAATNLASEGSTTDVFNEYLTYDNMLSQLNKMAGSMGSRTSLAEMMTNIWENGQYTLASSMASSPVSYLLYKMASLLEDATGGIDLPFINVMGFGVDLNTTVADLMRVASLSGGILGSLGSMISGLSSSFSGQAMLSKMGIDSGSGLAVTPRGSGGVGASAGGGAQTTSSSGYVGNSSGSDVKDSTIQESEDSKKQQMIEAKEEEPANQVDMLNTMVLKIYELLDDVASGKRDFTVKVAGYGLTKLGSNSNALSSALGGASGTSALGGTSGASALGNSGNNALNNGSSGHTTSSSGTSLDSDFGVGVGVDLGGWTMM